MHSPVIPALILSSLAALPLKAFEFDFRDELGKNINKDLVCFIHQSVLST